MTINFANFDAHDYFFGSATTGERTTFTPKAAKRAFSLEWMKWRKEQTQPLIKRNLAPLWFEVLMDGVLKFRLEGSALKVVFRSDKARHEWENFLSARCPWLAYEAELPMPASTISIPIYSQEFEYEGALVEREQLRAVRTAIYDPWLTVYRADGEYWSELSCGDEVLLHPVSEGQEGFSIYVDDLAPHPFGFYRDDDLLTPNDCAYVLQVFLCGVKDRCELCEASVG